MNDQSAVADIEAFRADMRDDVLWVQWNHSTKVTDGMAAALIDRADQLCPDLCPPMLVELNAMVSLTPGALHVFATGLNIAAMALVGPSAVDRVLTNFFTEVHHPPYPTRHFDDPAHARAWLGDHPFST